MGRTPWVAMGFRTSLSFYFSSLLGNGSHLSLSLQATQVNNIQKYAVASVEIKVVNKSEHPPYFKNKIYNGTVFVGLALRSFVFQAGDPSSPLMITATDDDFPDVRNRKCNTFILRASGIGSENMRKGRREMKTHLFLSCSVLHSHGNFPWIRALSAVMECGGPAGVLCSKPPDLCR